VFSFTCTTKVQLDGKKNIRDKGIVCTFQEKKLDTATARDVRASVLKMPSKHSLLILTGNS